jgi:hypothetical protein
MAEGSTLGIELSGALADKLAITGNLDLSAMGNILSVTGSGTGSSWVIATYTGMLTGAFESILGGAFTVSYGTGNNSLITLMAAIGVPGDYNNNGKVDAADYSIWRDHLGQNFQLTNEGVGQSPGQVTQADYDFWVSQFGIPGAGSGSLADAAVPEPASALLAGLALVGVIGIVRRHGRL